MTSEQHAAEPIVEAKRTLWKDFGYYTLWWTVVMGIFGGLMPVYDTSNFAVTKVLQLLYGMAFGFVCALLFTIAQNLLNASRKKPVSWALAIAIWMGMKFAAAFSTGAL